MAKYDSRLDQLSRLYTLYDRFMDETEFVCHKGCSSCCTCNVTLSSLELDHIKSFLGPEEYRAIVELIKKNMSEKRYQPKTTINGFALACVEGHGIIEEENDPRWGTCPLLVDHICTIYPVRPFGCRSLVSTQECASVGAATLPLFTLTVNNVFMQYIEHLDAWGVSGNLVDMFLVSFQESLWVPHGIIKNQGARVLMVPPEHRERIRPLLQEMTGIFNPI